MSVLVKRPAEDTEDSTSKRPKIEACKDNAMPVQVYMACRSCNGTAYTISDPKTCPFQGQCAEQVCALHQTASEKKLWIAKDAEKQVDFTHYSIGAVAELKVKAIAGPQWQDDSERYVTMMPENKIVKVIDRNQWQVDSVIFIQVQEIQQTLAFPQGKDIVVIYQNKILCTTEFRTITYNGHILEFGFDVHQQDWLETATYQQFVSHKAQQVKNSQ